MAASRRYYPGFLGALFLVLLRIAIGWHFLYEGVEKIESTRKGNKPFNSEVYLRNATGPLAPRFRALVPDVNSLAKLDPERLKAAWRHEAEAIERHYGFDQEQKAKAEIALGKALEFADIWFQDRDTTEKRLEYYHNLREIQAVERNGKSLTFERERAADWRRDLDKERKELIAPLDARIAALKASLVTLATPEQREANGAYVPPRTSLDWINLSTMYGLVIIGICLIAGLFTPLAALAGAVFLAQIYLSMPPWPGLPPNPMAEGHYWFVNKNLIEMLACLVLATIPTGRWIGVDALLLGLFRRPEQIEVEHEPSAAPSRIRQPSTSSH